MTENDSAGDDEQDHARRSQTVPGGIKEFLPGELSTNQTDDHGPPGPDGTGLGRAEPAQEQPPDGEDKEDDRLDNS